MLADSTGVPWLNPPPLLNPRPRPLPRPLPLPLGLAIMSTGGPLTIPNPVGCCSHQIRPLKREYIRGDFNVTEHRITTMYHWSHFLFFVCLWVGALWEELLQGCQCGVGLRHLFIGPGTLKLLSVDLHLEAGIKNRRHGYFIGREQIELRKQAIGKLQCISDDAPSPPWQSVCRGFHRSQRWARTSVLCVFHWAPWQGSFHVL